MVFRALARVSEDEHIQRVVTGRRQQAGRCRVCQARGPCFAACQGDAHRLGPSCRLCMWRGACAPGCRGDAHLGAPREYRHCVSAAEVYDRVAAGLRRRKGRCDACGAPRCRTECPGDGPALAEASEGRVLVPVQSRTIHRGATGGEKHASFLVTYRWPTDLAELQQWIVAAVKQGFAVSVHHPDVVREAYEQELLADHERA